MSKVNLGKVRITFEGDWDTNKEYKKLSVVNNSYGVKYISKIDVPTNTPLSDTNYWETVTGNFVEEYQGASENDPTTRLDGSSLREGDLYYNTSIGKMRVYKGSEWLTIDTGELIKSYIFTDNGTLHYGALNVANAGNITLTLPDQAGFPVFIIDGTGDAANNPITVARQSSDVTINGKSEDLNCDVNNFNIVLSYDVDNKNWLVGGI